MEKQVIIDTSTLGRSLDGPDVNRMGASARMDDYVLAELLQMAPFYESELNGRIHKGVNTFASTGNLVRPAEVAAREVSVGPFRAFASSLQASPAIGDAAGNLLSYRDIRSALHVGAGVSSDPFGGIAPWFDRVPIAANSSGNPRIDVVYAAVVLDQPFGEARYGKNKTTSVVTASSVTTYLQSSVELRVATGTPAGSPVAPTLAADGTVGPHGVAEVYIPLAHVAVANGATSFSSGDITDVAPRVTYFVQGLRFASGATFLGIVGGTWTSSGTLTNSGTINNTGTIKNSGAGRFIRRIVTGSNANATYGANTADVVTLVGASAFTGNVDYTITSTGAVEGSELLVTMLASSAVGTNSITLKRDDASSIGSIDVTASGAFGALLLAFRSGVWGIISGIPNDIR